MAAPAPRELEATPLSNHFWNGAFRVTARGIEAPPLNMRLDTDETHSAYDPAAAQTCWRVLLAMQPVMESFRGGFVGKCSPVHFFWGAFDLAVSRFNGARAPERTETDKVMKKIMQEAYSHEVISHGFWPGGGPVPEPVFYAYVVPEPEGFRTAAVRPDAAFYSTEMSEFLLPYEAVRTSRDPEASLRAFLDSTYTAASDLANWERAKLER